MGHHQNWQVYAWLGLGVAKQYGSRGGTVAQCRRWHGSGGSGAARQRCRWSRCGGATMKANVGVGRQAQAPLARRERGGGGAGQRSG